MEPGGGDAAAAALAVVTRDDVATGTAVAESWHRGHVAATVDGEVVDGLGDPELVTFVRSTAKPFQATACLELLTLGTGVGAGPGTVPAGGPAPDEVAVSWASHRAEPIHLAAVGRLLARSATRPDQLTCPSATGEDAPADPASPLRHNCSGKHALFALAGARQGTDRARLLDPDGPLQRLVLAAVADALGPPVAVGVDGCGAPAVAVPLAALARGFGALATEDRWARVRDAGLAHPDLVGGRGRLETALLGAGTVAKIGADGVFAAGWRADDGTARGLAVKVADGAERAATAVTAAIAGEVGRLPRGAWSPPAILGGGRPAGAVAVTDPVRRLATRLVGR